jgi:hypothetical protein
MQLSALGRSAWFDGLTMTIMKDGQPVTTWEFKQ